MNILFSADLHIKLGQKNVPLEWAKNRYALLIAKLVEQQKKADMFIIGGDIFDRVPTMEELEIYYNLVDSCTIPTLIYSGNHEAAKRNTTFLTYLKSVTNKVNDNVHIIDDFYKGVKNPFDIIPYNKLKEPWPEFTNKLLFTHVRGEIPPHVKPEINLELFDRWETVIAGDLHSYSNSQRNILYPGSPITTSFHRNEVDTGVILFNTDTMAHKWVKLDLPQLIRKTIEAGEAMPATEYHHTIYEITGDISELGVIEDSELIDKKVVKRHSDTALILDPTMTLQEEVKEYLLYILSLEDNTVEEVIQLLNNNMEKIRE